MLRPYLENIKSCFFLDLAVFGPYCQDLRSKLIEGNVFRSLLFSTHTRGMDYVTKTFVSGSSSIWGKQLHIIYYFVLCTVKGTKEFVKFHNHSQLGEGTTESQWSGSQSTIKIVCYSIFLACRCKAMVCQITSRENEH